MERPIILSILICHLPHRIHELERLMDCLQPSRFSESVEMCIDDGEGSIGEKRNRLIDKAKGEYIAFIDDDDTVSDNYLELCIESLKVKPDCVGITGTIMYQGTERVFKHSIQYACWYTGSNGTFYRTPNHLNPIKKVYALKARFPEIMSGEDITYSKRIRPMLKKEVMIKDPIYFYTPSVHV